MSKKDLNVILKKGFKDHKEFSEIYLNFQKKLNSFKKKIFLIAVSGGPDSLALTALSKAYSYNNNWKIYYVLIDHKLRKNSSIEAYSVKKLLKKHKIINKNSTKLKILGTGEIKNKVNIEANLASKSAVKKLEKIGGSIQLKK